MKNLITMLLLSTSNSIRVTKPLNYQAIQDHFDGDPFSVSIGDSGHHQIPPVALENERNEEKRKLE